MSLTPLKDFISGTSEQDINVQKLEVKQIGFKFTVSLNSALLHYLLYHHIGGQ